MPDETPIDFPPADTPKESAHPDVLKQIVVAASPSASEQHNTLLRAAYDEWIGKRVKLHRPLVAIHKDRTGVVVGVDTCPQVAIGAGHPREGLYLHVKLDNHDYRTHDDVIAHTKPEFAEVIHEPAPAI